ncbi:MAG: hypothetical protein GY702_18935 [Desulfobulbaceae bacterium]|nr:hypothetical protein [Desulfobulbaceae bacterium]
MGQSFFTRGILSVVLLLFLLAVVTRQLGPAVWNWLRVTLVILSSIALFTVSTVPAHFLDEHLWNHVVKALTKATDVVFSHFHGDHIPHRKANPYQLA